MIAIDRRPGAASLLRSSRAQHDEVSMPPAALIVGSPASPLAASLHATLSARGFAATLVSLGDQKPVPPAVASVHPRSAALKEEARAAVDKAVARGSLRIVVLASEESSREPRNNLNDADQLDDQFARLMEGDARAQMLIAMAAMPFLLKDAKAHVDPSHLLILGSRLTRSSTSPGQAIAAASKRALQSFGGSLFFELRGKGLKVAMIHPGPEPINSDDLANLMVFPVEVGPTACVEAVEISTVKPSQLPRLSPTFRGGCFVTGGSKGIGRAIAVAMCKQFRMPVALVGRDQQSLTDAANECAAFVPRSQVHTYAFDVRDNAAMKRAADDASARFGGGITVLVCSAGINRRRWAISPDGTKFADPKLWQELLEINMSSSMSATGYALPHMLKGTTAEGVAPCILYVGSRVIRNMGSPGQQSYAASKMALAGFSQSIHYEVRSHGIRACCLNVGIVATDLGSRPPSSGSFNIAKNDRLIQSSDVALISVKAVGSPAYINITAIDMSGTEPEFISKDGKNLRMSEL